MPAVLEKQDRKHISQRKISQRRSQLELARLEYWRTLKSEADILTQREIADAASISQPSVSEALNKAREIDEPREGFSSGSLHEMFLRYSAGELSQKQLIKELSEWQYDKPSVADSLDGLLVDLPNTFRDVEDALVKGIIEPDVYNAVVSAIRNRD